MSLLFIQFDINQGGSQTPLADMLVPAMFYPIPIGPRTSFIQGAVSP